jgi:GTP-binding protein HflX
MATGREVRRSQRRARELPSVAIAGYTNAGKSSLLNRLTGSGVLVADALFATLDSAVRRSRMPSGRIVTLTDTVGFVRHLPHQLVDAFRATLEEIAQADLILHVVDGSDPDPSAQLRAVREVLREIGAGDVAELVVINKADVADPAAVEALRLCERDCALVSARTGEGIEELLVALERALPRRDREVRVVVPYERGDLISRAHEVGEVLSLEHGAKGTLIQARLPEWLAVEFERADGRPSAGALTSVNGHRSHSE